VRSSSKTEPCSRGRSALDRDGSPLEGASNLERGRTPLKGAPSPRARRNLTRGADRSSSEVGFYRRGTIPVERSGVPPEGG
jgi:hypothetical protein